MGLLLFVALPQAQRDSPEDELARAEVMWSANMPEAYEFTFERICFCAPRPPGQPPWVFRVRNGHGSLIGETNDGRRADFEKYSTVEKQFAFIRSALEKKPERAEIGYDPKHGYPKRVYIDPRRNTFDDEHGFVIKDFRALSAPRSIEELRKRGRR